MQWFIGIDGGGTKTSFAIGRTDAVPVNIIVRSGCSYQEIGAENVVSLILEGVEELIKSVGATPEECAGCCIGLPCFGENKNMDIAVANELKEKLNPIPIKIVNDGIVGWAGSLECSEGIHLVSGTGSIAFGCNASGEIARAGGWNEFFDDNGSCYWIGREAMNLFSKQADGRAPKGALYDLIYRDLQLTEDFEFIKAVLKDIAPHRDRVAKFQIYAFEAAKSGDESAAALYPRAAKELALLVSGVKQQLSWSVEPVKVSYFGGLFNTGDMILKPLSEELDKLGCVLQAPAHTATEGALRLAIKEYSKEE